MRRLVGAWFVFGGMALLCAGCGDSSALLPATGTVTYQGKPVENAVVSFLPEQGVMGTGTTDASGKYEIHTGGKPGATPGKNQVSISKFSSQATTTMKAEDMQKMAQKMTQPGGGAPISKNELPVKYSSPKESGFSADVQSGKSVFDFTLTD